MEETEAVRLEKGIYMLKEWGQEEDRKRGSGM